jgi:hypothetical protein
VNLAAQTGAAPAALASPGLMIGGALMAWAVDYEVQKGEVSGKSIARKQIFEKSIFSGETHSGFVYFKGGDRRTLGNIERLMVRMTGKPSDRAIDLVVPIGIGAEPK